MPWVVWARKNRDLEIWEHLWRLSHSALSVQSGTQSPEEMWLAPSCLSSNQVRELWENWEHQSWSRLLNLFFPFYRRGKRGSAMGRSEYPISSHSSGSITEVGVEISDMVRLRHVLCWKKDQWFAQVKVIRSFTSAFESLNQLIPVICQPPCQIPKLLKTPWVLGKSWLCIRNFPCNPA